jgi:uncharacterized protein DUF222
MFDSGGETTVLQTLGAAVDSYRAQRPAGRDSDALQRELIGLRRLCDRLELHFSMLSAEYAASQEWGEDSHFLSPIQALRQVCQMTCGAVMNALTVGEQAPLISASVGSMLDGRISYTKLAMLGRTAETLRDSPTSTGFDEARLLRKAERHTVSEFRRDCTHARYAADQQGFLEEQLEGVETRSLEINPREDGDLFYIRGWLDAEGGATLRAALEPKARPCGAGDHRNRDRRLADALIELCNYSLDNGLVPQHNGQRPHVQVTTTLETLLALPGAPAGELEFGPPIAAETVRRLACDSGVVRILLGADSAVVDVGRLTRVVPAATRRALNVRDRGCVWPGCDRPAAWTQVHHVMHWTAHRGPTNVSNLVLLCHRHHFMAHEGGWQLVREADGTVLSIPPVPDYEHRIRMRDIQPSARAPDLATI